MRKPASGLVALTVVLATLAFQGAHAVSSYGPVINSSALGRPVAHAMGDFNLDGRLDAAAVISDSTLLTILLGNGDGTFSLATALPTGAGPTSSAVGDIDGDLLPDVLVTNGSASTFTVFRGLGNGNFVNNGTIPTGGLPSGIALDDFNTDGRLDAVVTNQVSGSVMYFAGNGLGGFSAPSTFLIGGNPSGVATGSLDFGPTRDVAVSNLSGQVHVLLGNGAGGFTPQIAGVATGGGARSVATGDLTGDGRDEIAVVTSGGTVDAFTYNGMGWSRFSTNFMGSGRGIAIADMDLDGRADVAAQDINTGRIYVFDGNGMGGFTGQSIALNHGGGSSSATASVSLADVNNDGAPDVETTNYNANSVSVFLNLLAPSPPLNLTATAGPNGGEITLNWQQPASGTPDRYNIYRGLTSGGETFIAQIPAWQTNYSDFNLAPGTRYFYQVTAVRVSFESQMSNEADATTFDFPTAPLNLAANAGPGQGQISLNWQPPSSDGGAPVQYYVLSRGTSSGGEMPIALLGSTSYLDAGLSDGTTYYYTVAAVNAVGQGPDSNEASATTFGPPSAPQNVSAVPGMALGEIRLSWDPPTSDGGLPITNHVVCRGTTSGVNVLCVSLGTATTYSDGGLLPLTTYYYVVYAENAAGRGPSSNEVCTKPFPWAGPLGC